MGRDGRVAAGPTCGDRAVVEAAARTGSPVAAEEDTTAEVPLGSLWLQEALEDAYASCDG